MLGNTADCHVVGRVWNVGVASNFWKHHFSLFLLNLHGRLNMVKTCRQSYKKIRVLSEAANSSNIEKLLKILATKNYKSKVHSEKEERKPYIYIYILPR